MIFAIEMILKLFGLGPKRYIMDRFNVFDAIVVIIGLLDFLHVGSKALTVFRCFRLLRIFKIVRSWSNLRKILQTVLESFASIANLALLMFLLIFIYALIGMQFFSKIIKDDNGEPVRFTFTSFGYALITIFVLLTGENWNSIMQIYYAEYGPSSSLYFVSLIIFGNIMLLNLFLAILLNFISSNLDEEDQHTESDNDDEDPLLLGQD